MSNTATDSKPTVLIVDDERALADLYEEWLSDDYEVLTAYSGADALELIDETVDVVLLDRRMPGVTGDQVLSEIREDAIDSRVVMVTAVEPDFDILEMGFDDYVTKPVDRQDLHAIVERMLNRRDYDQQLQHYFQLLAKRAALEDEKTTSALKSSDAFSALQAEIADLEADLDEAVGEFTEEDFRAQFRDLEGATDERD